MDLARPALARLLTLACVASLTSLAEPATAGERLPRCPSGAACVRVDGAVASPGFVLYSDVLTVREAIANAGGLVPSAASRVTIVRPQPGTAEGAEHARISRLNPNLLGLGIGYAGSTRVFWSITPDLQSRSTLSDAREAFVTPFTLDIGERRGVDDVTFPLQPGDIIIVLQRRF